MPVLPATPKHPGDHRNRGVVARAPTVTDWPVALVFTLALSAM